MNQEQQAITLRQQGMSYADIVQATGLSDYKVKKLVKDVPKVKPINTPFDKAVARVYDLAIRPHGIRDYELRDILHQEYRSIWNTTTGRYDSGYDKDKLKRVREKVRLRAAQEDRNVFFVMDWVDVAEPTVSWLFLQTAANDIASRIDSYVNEFMELHATRWEEDSEEVDYAQRKQMYAAKHHLLKMVAPGFGKEPLEKLLDRSVTITDALEGTPDIPLPPAAAGRGVAKPEYYPEPNTVDHFLDHAESQGWLKDVENTMVL